jgi:hypothetical protein
MILNAYAVLDGFLSVLRLGLGLLVVRLAFLAWRMWRQSHRVPTERTVLEDRCHLLFLLAGVLVTLNVASWPVFYLLLQSYVPEWPGVMCVYGVTRIGAGSLGTARFLPPLVGALEVAKPALVFLSGCWLTLHLINRRTATAALTGRVLALLLAAGLLAAADAAGELAYLAIPKKEVFATGGCCTEAFDVESHSSRFVTGALAGDNMRPWLYTAYYAVNIGMVVLLGFGARWFAQRPSSRLLAPVLLAGASLMVNAVFLVEVAAPRLLGLPYHHCPYDLIPEVPESLVAVALFIAGCFCVGWAAVAGLLGDPPGARPFVTATVGSLLSVAFFGYVGSIVMLSTELILA